jgi:hypothetical protein
VSQFNPDHILTNTSLKSMLISVYIISNIGWLVGDNLLLLRNFGPYGIIFMNVCVLRAVAMVMLLKDFGPYGITFMTMCVYYFIFSRNS